MKTTKNEWVEFWKKLGRMLEAGIPILAVFEAIGKEAGNPTIKETVRIFEEQIREGNSFVSAMERLPGLFTPSMIKMMQVGEMTGKVPSTMLSLAAGIEEGSFSIGSGDEGVVDIPPADAKDQPVAESDLPIIKLVSCILRDAYQQKASAIHIEVMPSGIQLRFRVDGVLHEMPPPPKELGAVIVSRIKIMANMNVPEKRLPQDGRIQVRFGDQTVDLRVSYVPITDGESIVLRLLTAPIYMPGLEQIFKADHLTTVQRWLKQPPGLMVVTGPNGSGKTTTLYSILKSFDPVRTKIITVEHPVECRMEGICQQGINPSLGLTFPAALRVARRQDPDVIMAGEIRDPETASILAEMALTGHRVFTSLHTNGAVEVARRLVDIGLEPHVVSSMLVGVIAQRLFRLICPNCKAEIKPEPWMRDFFPQGAMPKLFKGKGCAQCHQTGYSGRSALHEIFEPSGEVIRKLAQDVSCASMRAEAIRAGMVTLRSEGLAKVAEGLTTLEEILLVTPPDA